MKQYSWIILLVSLSLMHGSKAQQSELYFTKVHMNLDLQKVMIIPIPDVIKSTLMNEIRNSISNIIKTQMSAISNDIQYDIKSLKINEKEKTADIKINMLIVTPSGSPLTPNKIINQLKGVGDIKEVKINYVYKLETEIDFTDRKYSQQYDEATTDSTEKTKVKLLVSNAIDSILTTTSDNINSSLHKMDSFYSQQAIFYKKSNNVYLSVLHKYYLYARIDNATLPTNFNSQLKSKISETNEVLKVTLSRVRKKPGLITTTAPTNINGTKNVVYLVTSDFVMNINQVFLMSIPKTITDSFTTQIQNSMASLLESQLSALSDDAVYEIKNLKINSTAKIVQCNINILLSLPPTQTLTSADIIDKLKSVGSASNVLINYVYELTVVIKFSNFSYTDQFAKSANYTKQRNATSTLISTGVMSTLIRLNSPLQKMKSFYNSRTNFYNNSASGLCNAQHKDYLYSALRNETIPSSFNFLLEEKLGNGKKVEQSNFEKMRKIIKDVITSSTTTSPNNGIEQSIYFVTTNFEMTINKVWNLKIPDNVTDIFEKQLKILIEPLIKARLNSMDESVQYKITNITYNSKSKIVNFDLIILISVPKTTVLTTEFIVNQLKSVGEAKQVKIYHVYKLTANIHFPYIIYHTKYDSSTLTTEQVKLKNEINKGVETTIEKYSTLHVLRSFYTSSTQLFNQTGSVGATHVNFIYSEKSSETISNTFTTDLQSVLNNNATVLNGSLERARKKPSDIDGGTSTIKPPLLNSKTTYFVEISMDIMMNLNFIPDTANWNGFLNGILQNMFKGAGNNVKTNVKSVKKREKSIYAEMEVLIVAEKNSIITEDIIKSYLQNAGNVKQIKIHIVYKLLLTITFSSKRYDNDYSKSTNVKHQELLTTLQKAVESSVQSSRLSTQSTFYKTNANFSSSNKGFLLCKYVHYLYTADHNAAALPTSFQKQLINYIDDEDIKIDKVYFMHAADTPIEPTTSVLPTTIATTTTVSPPDYTDQPPVIGEYKRDINIVVKFNWAWDEQLNDQKSNKSKSMIHLIYNKFKEMLRKKNLRITTFMVISFKKGSVKADMEFTVAAKTSYDESEMKQIVSGNINSTFSDGANVEQISLSEEQQVKSQPPTTLNSVTSAKLTVAPSTTAVIPNTTFPTLKNSEWKYNVDMYLILLSYNWNDKLANKLSYEYKFMVANIIKKMTENSKDLSVTFYKITIKELKKGSVIASVYSEFSLKTKTENNLIRDLFLNLVQKSFGNSQIDITHISDPTQIDTNTEDIPEYAIFLIVLGVVALISVVVLVLILHHKKKMKRKSEYEKNIVKKDENI